MTTVKHCIYTLVTFIVYVFGLTMLNQSQELNNTAKVISLTIIAFAGFLSYELMTTKDYKMMPLLMFLGAVATMIGLMCLYTEAV